MRNTVLFLLLLTSQIASAGTTCAASSYGSGLCFDNSRQSVVSPDVQALVRAKAEDYLDTLLSDQFTESDDYWSRRSKQGSRPRQLRETLGLDTRHLETSFRGSFSAAIVKGHVGNYVVTEYGTRNAEFDVIHFIIWEDRDEGWRIVCHSYVLSCPPDSRPVDLSP